MKHSILYPNTGAPKTAQYDKAWHDLGHAEPHEAAHAKCWLTYRAVEGEITPADWEKHVHQTPVGPQGSDGLTVRWAVAQAAAEFYYFIGQGDEQAAKSRANLIAVADLNLWPDAITSFCRVQAIMAWSEIIAGRNIEAEAIIKSALARWQSVMGTMDMLATPDRIAELGNDLDALNCLLLAAQHIKILTTTSPLKNWIAVNLQKSKHPWRAALMRVVDDSDEAIIALSPAGKLVSHYKTIHAMNPQYGSGPKDEYEVAWITEALSSHPAASVIDFGCGNSRLAEKLFPSASVFRYDPAIEDLATAPERGRTFDVGICTDVLEHVPESELAALIARFRALAPTWYFTIHTGPAAQLLPDGQNAHCTQHPPEWWQELLGGKIVWSEGQRFGLLVTW